MTRREETTPRLVAELRARFAEYAELKQAVTAKLKGSGYGA